MASGGPPRGCGDAVSSIYYNLCDLGAPWGVVVEAIAALGLLTSLLVLMCLVTSLPFVSDQKRRDTVALQAGLLVFALGLFGLTFAFIVAPYHVTCAARRFLFGILFSGCFACLLMHGLWIVLIQRGGWRPPCRTFCLGALALWLVEVIINAEWLIITVVRTPTLHASDPDLSCSIANEDFVMALIYAMVLLMAAVLVAVPAVAHQRKEWRPDAAFILVTGVCTVAIWMAWIAMFLYGNQAQGDATWDDPTLAVGLVVNAWVFLGLYAVPQMCLLTREDLDLESPHDEVRPVKGQLQRNHGVENQAFDAPEYRSEPNVAKSLQPSAPEAPKAPPQLRSAAYKPTALSIIMEGMANDQTPSDVLLQAAVDQRHAEASRSPPLSAHF